MRYLVYGFVKMLLLLVGPMLMMIGTLIGIRFMWWLFKRKLARWDAAIAAEEARNGQNQTTH